MMVRAIKIGLLVLSGLLFGAPSCEDNRRGENSTSVTGVAGGDALFSQSLADRLSESELRSFEVMAVQKLNDFADLAGIVHDVTLDTTFRVNAARMIRDLFTNANTNLIMPSGNSGQANRLTLDQFLSAGIQNKGSRSFFAVDSVKIIMPLDSISENTFNGTLGFLVKCQDVVSKERKTKSLQLSIQMNLIRIEKNFGDERLKVWEVRLGDMKLQSSE
jgi:hypothetical protein